MEKASLLFMRLPDIRYYIHGQELGSTDSDGDSNESDDLESRNISAYNDPQWVQVTGGKCLAAGHTVD